MLDVKETIVHKTPALPQRLSRPSRQADKNIRDYAGVEEFCGRPQGDVGAQRVS